MVNILYTFHAFSAGALWLLGTLIFMGVNKTGLQADRWLGTYYFLLACLFTQLFLEGFHIDNGALIHVLELPRWATLPCFYLAVHHMVKPTTPIRYWGLHFVPFLAFLLFSAIYLIPGLFNSYIIRLNYRSGSYLPLNIYSLHNVSFIGLPVTDSSKYIKKTFASCLPIWRRST